MHILMTGGTGLIGQSFIKRYADTHQFTVVTRDINRALQIFGELVAKDIVSFIRLDELASLKKVDAVINLAGEPIADKRWNAQQKQRICQSRWHITQALIDWLAGTQQKPSVVISGSAIGYYGRQGEQHIDEHYTDIHHEFSHEICARWEEIAQHASDYTRVCIIRTGVVLSAQGGALAKMLMPFKLGLGGPVSPGTQGFSWIHIEDMIAGIAFLLNHDECAGVYNFTAPHPVSNKVFSKALAQRLRRPCIFTVPQFSMKLLLSEGADLLTTGQFVVPARLLDSGFTFDYPEVDKALASLDL